jgi:hypothetical protein
MLRPSAPRVPELQGVRIPSLLRHGPTFSSCGASGKRGDGIVCATDSAIDRQDRSEAGSAAEIFAQDSEQSARITLGHSVVYELVGN